MLPLKIYTRRKIFNYYQGLSFFIFVWICDDKRGERWLIRHEKIHFFQQVELLFVFHWLLYTLFYLLTRLRGHGHFIAYRYNPFELEAYDNDRNEDYLRTRKIFAWAGSVKTYFRLWRTNFRNVSPRTRFNG